jgi:long-chain acyl-CoA synthetase
MKAFTETTLPNLFFNRVYRFGSKPFLYYKHENQWEHHTWQDVGDTVEMHGRGLMTLGMKKGDRICLISENRPEWVIFDLAILSIGAVTVPIYATSTLEQMTHIIEHCEAKMVIVSNATLLEQLRKHSPHSHVEHWVCFEKTLKPSKCMTPLWIAEHSSKTDNFSFYQTVSLVTPQDLATIVYTSGTTGEPKGVMLSHENIVSNTIASAKMIPIQEDDISLSFLPLSHLFERMAGFFCFMYFGAKIYFAEDVHKVPENLLETHPTILISVPRVLEKVYNKVFEDVEGRGGIVRKLFAHSLKTRNPLFKSIYSSVFFQKIKDRMGGRLRFIVVGGAALNPTIGLFFERIGIPVLQGYGLTETSPVIAVNKLNNNRIGTVGYVLDNLEVKLSEEDEILVKGPSVMMGYYKNEKATQEAFTDDGFFKTGDIGEYKGGFLKITDRKKELIVTSGGKKIAPQPIENELVHHPIIDQVCLVGEGMKTIGALIVPNQSLIIRMAAKYGIDVSNYPAILEREEIRNEIQKIVDQVNLNLSSFQQIKNFHLIAEPFSQENDLLTLTLKLKRKNISKKYGPEIEALFVSEKN